MHLQVTVPAASSATEVLLLHAPYPGTLKFEGSPSSLLAAAAPFARRLAADGRLGSLGLLDPGSLSHAYRDQLRASLSSNALRVLCVSTSTAAIEEAARAVQLARECRGSALLIVVGGPHEDDCDDKVAHRMEGVDLSIAGECELVLERLLHEFLAREETPETFLSRTLPGLIAVPGLQGGPVTLASPWWGRELRILNLPPWRPDEVPDPVWSHKRAKFSVFEAIETLPLMLSRGCPFGRCTFCSEANRDGVLVRQTFDWVRAIAEARPGAALYFQDSIMPAGDGIESGLLPLLKELGRPWGCQVFLPTLRRSFLKKLAASGCRYVYTGLESGSGKVRDGIGKGLLQEELVLERLAWMRDLGLDVGISLMFGALSTHGELLESARTVQETTALAERIVAACVPVVGFYPNVMTVLPGTMLARGLASAGMHLDFYRMPRSSLLEGFEDGSVGYNFTTISGRLQPETKALALEVVEAARRIQDLGRRPW